MEAVEVASDAMFRNSQLSLGQAGSQANEQASQPKVIRLSEQRCHRLRHLDFVFPRRTGPPGNAVPATTSYSKATAAHLE